MEIVWDEIKRTANLAKHGLDFADLSEDWFIDATVEPAKQGRWKATGELNGEVVIAVIFRPLGGEAISVISMRRASARERSRR